eukprot:TRINITY_DN4660_c0_g3_i4.p1 TRINITY_DN4660_c0_g3~~TRINITY_DN4660_c0_g3_i4.p1  ORF type:complete len:119 (+),score=23.75 TRINITY_DN4660_c0_g3_i4:245-601(+)
MSVKRRGDPMTDVEEFVPVKKCRLLDYPPLQEPGVDFKCSLRQILEEEATTPENIEDLAKAVEFPKWDQQRHKLTVGELAVLRLIEGSDGRAKKFQPSMEIGDAPSRPPTPIEYMDEF